MSLACGTEDRIELGPAPVPGLGGVSVVVVVVTPIERALVVVGMAPTLRMVLLVPMALVAVLVLAVVTLLAETVVSIAVVVVVVEGRGDMIPHPTDHSVLSFSTSCITC